MRNVLKVTTLLVVTVFLTGCMKSQPTPQSQVENSLPVGQSESEIDAANRAARVEGEPLQAQAPPTESNTIEVSASNFEYSQKEIRVKAGSTVLIDFSVQEGNHDFVIDELNVNSGVLSSGKSTEISIQIPEGDAGKTYDFYCSVMNHREQGMEGTLIIE